MEAEKNKKNTIIKILIVIILILTILLLRQCGTATKTAVIVDGDEPVQEVINGQIRIKINPSITIKEGTMQNMEFCNYNVERLMRLKIRAGEEQIYESQFVKPGDILSADVIETKKLKKGLNDVTAEIFTYNMKEEAIGQTNVKIVLDLK